MDNVRSPQTTNSSVIRDAFYSSSADVSDYLKPDLEGYLQYLFNFKDPSASLYEQIGRIAAIPAVILFGSIPVSCSSEKSTDQSTDQSTNKSPDKVPSETTPEDDSTPPETPSEIPPDEPDVDQPCIQSDERCDGKDNDCDGQADEELGTTVCGFGPCEHIINNCVQGVVNMCDPFEGAAAEICDGLDNDCDGNADEFEDLRTTTCGLGICQHAVNNCVEGAINVCDPMDGAMEEICDRFDNDCDGLTDEELGQMTCGRGICAHTVDICIEGAINFCDPVEGSTTEICNNSDDDCDGFTDEELGQSTCGRGICDHTVDNCVGGNDNVCNPLEGTGNESCNNLDDNCDGLTDEALGQSSCGFGDCANTVDSCVEGRPNVCEPLPRAVPEICGDNLDNDCNGRADNGCVVVEWTKTHNGAASGEDYGESIAVDVSGNVYVAGSVTDATSQGLDFWIRKMSSDGNEIWTRTYNPAFGNDEAYQIALGSNNVYVTGYDTISDANIWTNVLDEDGNNIWTRGYNEPIANSFDMGTSVAVDADVNIYVAGFHTVSLSGSLLYRSWIRKMDPLGNTVWTASDPRTESLSSQFSDMALDSSQNIYLTGLVEMTGESNNIWIMKLDRDNHHIWTKILDGEASGDDRGNGIAVDEEDNVYVTGYISTISQEWNAFVRKMDWDGNEIWTKTYNGPANHRDQGTSIAVDASENVYITGSERAPNESCNILVRKMDRDGNTVWTQTHNGPANSCDVGEDIAVDENRNIYVTGMERVSGESTNIWMRKYREIE